MVILAETWAILPSNMNVKACVLRLWMFDACWVLKLLNHAVTIELFMQFDFDIILVEKCIMQQYEASWALDNISVYRRIDEIFILVVEMSVIFTG